MVRPLVLLTCLAFCNGEINIVAFTAGEDSHRDVSSASTVTYPKIITRNNAHIQSGVFTCTSSGLYKFQVYALTQRNTTLFLDIYHNSKVVASLWGHTETDYADAGNVVILNLANGDTVQVKTRDGFNVSTYGKSDQIYSTFTGIQLGTNPNTDAPLNAFSVALTTHENIPGGAPVIYDSVQVDTEYAYNSSSGIYTAPSSGIYVFHFFSLAQKDLILWQELFHNDQYVCSLYGETNQESADAGNSVILHLKAGDTVQIKAHSSQINNIYGAPDELDSTFSGYMLLPENAIDTAAGGPTAFFSAGLTQKTTFQDGDKVVFDRVFTDHGAVNRHYDHLNGEFTAPYSGLYEFNFHVLGQNSEQVWLELYHNYRYVVSLYGHVPGSYAAGGNAAVIEMDDGDVAYIRAHGTNNLYGGHGQVYSTFSGALLHPREGVAVVGK